MLSAVCVSTALCFCLTILAFRNLVWRVAVCPLEMQLSCFRQTCRLSSSLLRHQAWAPGLDRTVQVVSIPWNRPLVAETWAPASCNTRAQLGRGRGSRMVSKCSSLAPAAVIAKRFAKLFQWSKPSCKAGEVVGVGFAGFWGAFFCVFVALGVEELSEGLGGWQEGGESQQPVPTPVQAAVGSHPQTAMPFVA